MLWSSILSLITICGIWFCSISFTKRAMERERGRVNRPHTLCYAKKTTQLTNQSLFLALCYVILWILVSLHLLVFPLACLIVSVYLLSNHSLLSTGWHCLCGRCSVVSGWVSERKPESVVLVHGNALQWFVQHILMLCWSGWNVSHVYIVSVCLW